jgi:hypothetical protein
MAYFFARPIIAGDPVSYQQEGQWNNTSVKYAQGLTLSGDHEEVTNKHFTNPATNMGLMRQCDPLLRLGQPRAIPTDMIAAAKSLGTGQC